MKRWHGTRSLVAVSVALAVGSAASACHRPGGVPNEVAGRGATVDSVKGIVRVVGVDALPQLTLIRDDGSPALTLIGVESLRRVAGLRVAVAGILRGTQLTVSRFHVIAANGVPAIDGTLALRGGALTLETEDGTRHTLVSPSPALRAAVGHRVWISGPLDRPAVAYGIIE
jgi:hypothetical protein